jgi:hypothetical protein
MNRSQPHSDATLSGLISLAWYPGQRLRRNPYMFRNMLSASDVLTLHHAQNFPHSRTGVGLYLAALFHGGERSEPEWNSAARYTSQKASAPIPAPLAILSPFGCCAPSGFLLFLRRQENEAAALAQRAIGGVRELVQPSDGLGPVRSPARAAHARCSKLERLPERRPGPSARISKDE